MADPTKPAPVGPDKVAAKRAHSLQKRAAAPWWATRLPTFRGWVYLGLFGLTWRGFEAIIANPKLLAVASFMQLFGALVTGGVLLIVLRMFPDKQAGEDKGHSPS